MGARPLSIGSIIAGKYRLVERLGGGGMGEVFRAENQLAGRMVALKLLRADFAGDDSFTKRFFIEAQAANKIRHPNIVDVLDAGFCDDGPYVVMECLEGTSVALALSKFGRFDVMTALAVVLPVLSALDAAHRQSIVHRDLKPENIFVALTNEGVRVKILDFGIAKMQDTQPGAPRTNTGVIYGTPDYLSPEQASGEGWVDGRSDIFSVATVLFELLTGKRPFEAASAVATAYRIVHGEAPALKDVGVEVENTLQNALDIAFSKNRDQRFPTAAAFADALGGNAVDPAMRRDALQRILDTSVGIEPTLPAADMKQGEFTFEPSLPIVLPAEPRKQPAKPQVPIAPTLVSQTYTPAGRGAPSITPASSSGARPASQPGSTQRSADASKPQIPTARPDSEPRISSRQPSSLSPSGRSRPGWQPRPLPVSVRGKCHARGSLPRAIAKWVQRAHGDDALKSVLAMLPPAMADDYKSDGFNALVWYDLEAIDVFLEAVTYAVLHSDASGWRTMARENFDRDLAPIFRPTTKLTDPTQLLKRIPANLQRVFDFGASRLIEQPQKAAIHIDGFDAASLPLRFVVLGTIEGLLFGVTGVHARITAGEVSFAPDFAIEISWRERR